MDKRLILAVAISAVVFGAAGFGGGTLLARGAAGGLAPGGQQAFRMGNGAPVGGAGRTGGGVAVGKVTEKSADSFTVKSPNGSSRTVYFSKSTAISEVASATSEDISVGATITAMGTTTSGGDITAVRITIGDALGGAGMRGFLGGGLQRGQGGRGGSAPGGQGWQGGPGGGPATPQQGGPPPGF